MDSELQSLIDFYCDRDMQDWFIPPPTFDSALQAYTPLVERARAGHLDHLEATPEGCLVLFILLDQIPRNIYRGSGAAFASDDKAYGIAVRAIARKFDQDIGSRDPMKQTLFYLPLEHAEDLGAQVAARALFALGVEQSSQGSEGRTIMENGLTVTERHLRCIMELGRFPGRNKALGRETTEREQEWLKIHPHGF